MDQLNPHSKDVHDGIEVVDQKRHELFLGQTRRPHANMKLWGFDPSKGEVYQVKIDRKKAVKVKDLGYERTQDTGTSKALLHSDHRYLWALNIKNALKKFRKAFGIPSDGDISKMKL